MSTEPNDSSDKTKFQFFTYDIWKSQGSSFRRSFLENFLSWATDNFPDQRKKLEKIEKKVRGKTRTISSNNQSTLDWYGIAVLMFLPFLPIYYFWAKSVFDVYEKAGNRLGFLLSYPFITLLLFVFATLARAIKKNVDNQKLYENEEIKTKPGMALAISQTLLINAKQFEDQKITQYIRETDPNDFEFQSLFRQILSTIQSDKEKIVIVLDNIDRLAPDEITEHWALVRSIFARGPLANRGSRNSTITAIVPYDRHLIEKELRIESTSQENDEISMSSISSREIFSKTFDEVLMVAPPVMSNSREFFESKMKQALPELDDDDELFRVYLVFNKIIQLEKGTATPRQIISFINEITGLYVLHDGRFRLPTVAIFIAYQDSLEANPSFLTESASINYRLRTIAADNDLERNLAAMIFNVEPE